MKPVGFIWFPIVTLSALLLMGCSSSDSGKPWGYIGFRVEIGTNVDIEYTDSTGALQQLFGLDLSSEWYETHFEVLPGETFYMKVTDHSGIGPYIYIWGPCDDFEAITAGGGTTSRFLYPLRSNEVK